MPRAWMWLGVLALVAGVLGVVDAMSRPAPASAQAGRALSQPIPPVPTEQRNSTTRNKIGWTAAKERWGLNMPMGRDVVVAQVEAPFRGGYIADTQHRDLPGTGFIPESGPARTSAHATTVASRAFGPDSAGQGVRAVHSFEVVDWLGPGFLNTASPDPPRTAHPARVFNHSWIAPAQQGTPNSLARVDYLADEHDLIFIVGVDNKPGPAPALLASAYNVISVGNETGPNTDGVTEGEHPGRAKPELVAPGGKTSWSAGIVTGVAAALLEVADRKVKDDPEGRNKDAARSEVIKAVLLAGAYRSEDWQPVEGESLDRQRGAGMVDIDRALVILEAGHAEPDQATDQRYGWSFAPVGSARQRSYEFRIDKPQGKSTFALTWHRRVNGGELEVEDPRTGQPVTIWDPRAFCPNLDLALFKVVRGKEEQVAVSTSTVDNVELIHVDSLDRGRYLLRVGRIQDDQPDAWDYAVAWRIEAEQ